MVRLQPDQLAKVDRWREAQDGKPSRPEAIRRLLSPALDQIDIAESRDRVLKLMARGDGANG